MTLYSYVNEHGDVAMSTGRKAGDSFREIVFHVTTDSGGFITSWCSMAPYSWAAWNVGEVPEADEARAIAWAVGAVGP